MLKHYIFFIFDKVLKFFFKKEEEPPPTYTFTMGRRTRPLVRRRPKFLKNQKEEEEDPFEKDKKNLLLP